MKDLFENKLSMLLRIQTHYANHAIELSVIPIIATFNTQLTANINQIITLAGQAGADITGYTVDKQDKKEKLIFTILKISTVYTMWAQLNAQTTDVDRFGLTIAALKAKRAGDLYTFAQNLSTTAQPKLAQLAPFGIVAADFTNLNTAAALFLEAIDAPNVQITERAAANRAMNQLMNTTIDELLRNLDYAMRILEFSHPSVYLTYKKARHIQKVAVRKKPDYNEDIAPNAILVVDELPYKASRLININNTGSTLLNLSVSNMPNQIQGNNVIIAPGKSSTRLCSTLNTDTNSHFILVQNTDPEVVGSFKLSYEK